MDYSLIFYFNEGLKYRRFRRVREVEFTLKRKLCADSRRVLGNSSSGAGFPTTGPLWNIPMAEWGFSILGAKELTPLTEILGQLPRRVGFKSSGPLSHLSIPFTAGKGRKGS